MVRSSQAVHEEAIEQRVTLRMRASLLAVARVAEATE